MNDQSIGIMNEAFFVSKGEILSWANKLLLTNLVKVEQFGTGAAYCQIVDSMFPGKVKMSRVNWKARNEWEFIVNLKILQQAFQKCNIKKYIEIEKLAKAKYQDNLEFAQWLKRFYDLNGGAQPDYDPLKARGGKESKDVELDFSFVSLRDNSKMRRERNDGSSDSRVSKKFISRSKSPVFKDLEKNPTILYNKSKEIQINNKIVNQKEYIEDVDTLIKKILQIEKITQSKDQKDSIKIENIKQVVEEAKKLSVFNESLKKKSLTNKNTIPVQQQQDSKIIMEETESPRRNVKKRNTGGPTTTSSTNLKKIANQKENNIPSANSSMIQDNNNNGSKRNANPQQVTQSTVLSKRENPRKK